MKSLYKLSIALAVAITHLFAQPTITSFTPTNGPIGTTVTITGNNFDPTAANNIVYFGAVKATVSSASSTSLTVKVPIGATYQPITVTVSGLTAYSNAPFVVTFTGGGSITSSSFASKVDFAAGTNPWGLAIGDIDGDGKTDLAVTNNLGGSTVSVFRNTSSSGSITASSFASKVDFTTGLRPLGVAIGDIDGDGKLDLVVTNTEGSSISVLRNTSLSGSITSGSFAAKVDFATGTNPFSVAIGDIDGDGKPDLVVANLVSNGTVSVFRNTSSSGSITSSSFAAKVDFTTGTGPEGIALGDVDGDGKPDLVVVNNVSSSVSVFRNTSTSGSITSGSFAPKVDFTTGAFPCSVAISDIDGDGKQDLVVANYGSNSAVSVFRNTSSSGSITSGSFAPKVDFATGTNPYSLAISDIDGDGKPDIVTANNGSNTVSLFRNTSSSGSITSGSFTAKTDFAVGTGPSGVVLSDVDGDGKPDIIITNQNSNTVSILRNMITLTPPTITSFTPTRNALNVEKNATIAITFDQDIIQTSISSSTICINGSLSGTHTFTQDYNSATKTVTLYPDVQFKVGEVVTTTLTRGIKSVAGDSLQRSYNWGFTIITNSASGIFTKTSSPLGGNNPHSVTAGDWNGDGYLDLAVADQNSDSVSILFNNGSGQFSIVSTVKVGSAPWYVISGDWNGDGHQDLAVTNTNSYTVSILFNNGSGQFTVASTVGVGVSPIPITTGDWNGDGSQDLAVGNNGDNTLSILMNNGSGLFTQTVRKNISGWYPYSLTTGDWNSDGYQDIVLINNQLITVSILMNNGSGQFTETTTSAGNSPAAVTSGDWNGDGSKDLAIANSGANTVSILMNNGSGQFTQTSTLGVGSHPYSITSGDWNGDGYLDLAVVNSGSTTISILMNNGSGQFSQTSTPEVGSGPFHITTGDWNGDGRQDLVVSNYSSNTVSILINGPSTVIAPDPGTISGSVLVGTSGLANVTVNLLDDQLSPISDMVTGPSGGYTFSNLTPGSYNVMIVEPLGYALDGNPKETILNPGGTNQVNFTLTPVTITNNGRGMGYWKQQYDKYITNKGNAQETQAQLNQYIVRVHQYYTPHFNVFSGLTTFSQWQAVLSAPNNASMLNKARQQLAALVMNFTSLKIGQSVVVTADGRTAGDVLTYVSIAVTGGDASKYELAKNLAEQVCSQQMIAAGVVPAGNVLYKGGAGQQVNWNFDVPAEFSLEQNYPNPFNPSTKISFSLPSTSYVSLRVFDVMGREVATLVSEELSAGNHTRQWNATGMPSGVYLYRLQAGSYVQTRKLILLK
ncbi:MAG: FG-GAP-like repeat-containing protein [Ignavibacteria bacterium]|nr:FG-GAP-like repeat-containing protein [Ignavibacteria bacterium]